MKVWFINCVHVYTSVEHIRARGQGRPHVTPASVRTIGFLTLYDEAVKYVLTSIPDSLYQNYYEYVVVEAVPAGVRAINDRKPEQTFFMWDKQAGHYIQLVDKPERLLKPYHDKCVVPIFTGIG